MTNIKAAVRAYIEDNFLMGAQSEPFTDSDSFMARHIVDSTGFLELVVFLEDTCGFEVHDAEMIPENLDSLDGIEAYVRRKFAATERAAA